MDELRKMKENQIDEEENDGSDSDIDASIDMMLSSGEGMKKYEKVEHSNPRQELINKLDMLTEEDEDD